MIGTKAVTVMGWIKSYSYGESGEGHILDNAKLTSGLANSTVAYFIQSDGSTYVKSANNSLEFNKEQFIVFTRESDGTTNFYIGDKNNAPILSGSADQDSGIPVAGTSNVIIGNISGVNKTFDGTINKLQVVEGILSLAEITQWYSETNKEI